MPKNKIALKQTGLQITAALFAILLLSSCDTGPPVLHNPKLKIPENQLMIRVMIVPHGRHVRIFARTPFRVMSADNSRQLLDEDNYTISKGAEITAIPGGIRIGRLKIITEAVRLVPLTNEPIQVYEIVPHSYRGELLIYRNEIDNTVDVVNEVGLEDYLTGVLGREVSASWPIEALKAQAVASRTRVLYQREFARHNEERFDVRADDKDQVYGGVSSDPDGDRIVEAVKATAGEVLTYHGAIFKNYFSSTCGGMTETAERVFHENPVHHPRGGIACPYCKSSPVYEWRHRIKASEAARRIGLHAGQELDTIKSIQTTGCDAAGHSLAVQVVSDKGTITFNNAYKFRTNVLGRSVQTEFWKDGKWHKAADVDPKHKEIIMSTSFVAKLVGQHIEFTGRGWGHGVGMCQFGAKTLAEQQYSYRYILSFYYPGALVAHNYNNQIP